MNDAKHLPTALIADDVSKLHDTGAGHPECIARFDAVMQKIQQADFTESLLHLKPRPATVEEIKACHHPDYIEVAKRDIAAGRDTLSTGDTTICRQSLAPALHAAGGVCVAVDAVFSGKARNAFCVHRPPGHHATPEKGMGFCVFNNAAIAARYAQAKHDIEKVLIVDWDVHHGNGTQDIFYDDPSVFFFSTHQSPWYPGTGDKEETGRGKGLGTTMNRPFPAGAGRKELLGAFENDLAPVIKRFKPELVIISAGFDSRIDDPLGQFRLTDDDFSDLTAFMLQLADEHAESRVVSVLEGGYNLDGLAKAAAAHCGRMVQG
ncbi:MAG: histone deacetylase [Planctomycetaceae bacterium]|jgi:acetoin utilization deacetylase AcuC-like enzyme|nr:histone deacetylase [Planctomycetaceae bacterium]MBT6155410.1 histone deacetylase [Planctomycetaceae bacterium]MBT6487596.1 histone deacetylase [Planctomycetaceae bacterium]MBT6493408.1 histone deacetylase [Planctomycetaceae bacterium]